jgi:hypothetical protein
MFGLVAFHRSPWFLRFGPCLFSRVPQSRILGYRTRSHFPVFSPCRPRIGKRGHVVLFHEPRFFLAFHRVDTIVPNRTFVCFLAALDVKPPRGNFLANGLCLWADCRRLSDLLGAAICFLLPFSALVRSSHAAQHA